MNVCIFYSWQSRYKNNCDKIIGKALEKAIKELNNEDSNVSYRIERGGGGVLGVEHIDNNIDKIINYEADIAFVDYTHNGVLPNKNPETGQWEKIICAPNTNTAVESGKLEYALGPRHVFTIMNTAYGQLGVNLEMPFDIRQEHFPIPFNCDDSADETRRNVICEDLKGKIKGLLKKSVEDLLENQKIRFAPLIPLRNEYSKRLWQSEFKPSKIAAAIFDIIEGGHSFRLLGLPGLGKTRMIGEAFRGHDNDVYYCDCREHNTNEILVVLDKLMARRGDRKQTVILDNCAQILCGRVTEAINENGYNCQLITIHYDPKEITDVGIKAIQLKVEDLMEVVDAMVSDVKDMPDNVKGTIINMSGGFPLMAALMIDNYQKGLPLVNISKKDLYERMLGVESNNASDQDRLRVLTAFAILKFIGLYGPQEKQGRFVAGNQMLNSNLRGSEDEKLQLFKEVHRQYERAEILERQGNLVLMRLIPLAVYLCKGWFDKQTVESIAELIAQIRAVEDEGTRNMLVESLSRRITLLADVPLAKDLNDSLTNPDKSPFLTEEVVLSSLGSRLFLAFSEVNPEACAFALHRIIIGKTDAEIIAIEPARRNLAWALDHLAFDGRSFKNAMLVLASFSLVETEERLTNNTTGLFVNRFSILLPGTEVDLMTRLSFLKELSSDNRYEALIKQSLHKALSIGNFQRAGGAEKQGTRTLRDYVPKYKEIATYLNACFDMLLALSKNSQEIDNMARTIASNARKYYLQGMDAFLIKGLNELAPRRDYVWEEMKEALSFLIERDAPKRQNYRINEMVAWRAKLTKDDFVYALLNAGRDISRHYDGSFQQEQKAIYKRYKELARELIDKELYKDDAVVTAVICGQCYHYNIFGLALSEYGKEKGVQKDLLESIVEKVLCSEASKDGETLLIYFLNNVDDRGLLDETYRTIQVSEKKRLLTAIYAIKAEGPEQLSQLFELLDKGDIILNDFSGYFRYLPVNHYDVKYVANRLLDYGAEGAQLVLAFCHNYLFGEQPIDAEEEAIGRRCLLQVDIFGTQVDGFVYFHSMSSYLQKHHDEEVALHIQSVQEKTFAEYGIRDYYYLERLYRKVLKDYPDLLKPRLFELLDNKDVRHSWIEIMKTSYSQDGEEEPTYTLIPSEEWFTWLIDSVNSERAYSLAMMFSLAESENANPDMLKLVNDYWCDDVRGALSSRMHSYGWAGSGIPLYNSRIALCKDYIAKLTNEEAKTWFKQDISFWENEIKQELLENAHERAIYG